MFGWGIYSSSVSSKVRRPCVAAAGVPGAQPIQADVYAGNTGRRASRQKAIFLCNVVLGKPIALPEADHDFDAGVRGVAPASGRVYAGLSGAMPRPCRTLTRTRSTATPTSSTLSLSTRTSSTMCVAILCV
jgi:hypothetical protein